MARPPPNVLTLFREKGGVVRMSEALQAGISRKTLYGLLDNGLVERISRGVYRLTSLPGLSSPDLVAVAARVPNGVICLISALAFHELTTQIPHAVDIAISYGTRAPRVDYPPINVYRFSGEAFTASIQTPLVDGKRLRIYGPEKSIADAFKCRNKIGLDVALEALRTWRSRRRQKNLHHILEYARVCRVERILRPYLEALT